MKNSQFFESCTSCGSSHLKTIEGYQSNYLVKCINCKLVFCEKKPSVNELNSFYSSYAYSSDQFFSEITKSRYRDLLREFERFRNKNRILDIGCGSGFFLEVAKSHGWDVYGTEFSPKAVEICINKGIKMHEGPINGSLYPENTFDIITSFEVIEHINNPSDEVGYVQKFLRSGGLFYCTTPNFSSLSRKLLGAKWNIINYPEHLSYFTSSSLNNLLKRHQFQKVKIKTTGFSFSRYRLSRGKADKVLSRDSSDEKIRNKTEKSIFFFLIKKIVNGLFDFLKIGDTLKVYYIKK